MIRLASPGCLSRHQPRPPRLPPHKPIKQHVEDDIGIEEILFIDLSPPDASDTRRYPRS